MSYERQTISSKPLTPQERGERMREARELRPEGKMTQATKKSVDAMLLRVNLEGEIAKATGNRAGMVVHRGNAEPHKSHRHVIYEMLNTLMRQGAALGIKNPLQVAVRDVMNGESHERWTLLTLEGPSKGRCHAAKKTSRRRRSDKLRIAGAIAEIEESKPKTVIVTGRPILSK
ncbi:hypothetical protein [Rosenbergiella nectarea]|uniref:hypothetical protein n=1 Tax=Rosenbergiella nectarea TaxID=988801 RepID=UPI001F4E1DD9|nr:hypothetical protein [Rosenbergiella nectarea]